MDKLNIVFGIVTVISLLVTIYYGKKASKLEQEKKKVDWKDLQSCANDLGQELKKTKFTPDIIFTPGLRGATFANLILNEVSYKTPVYVGISYWKNSTTAIFQIKGYQVIETSKWNIFIPELLIEQKDKKILIVDDYAMSGDFLKSMVDMLIEKGLDAKKIKTLTIATTKIAIENHKEPDYYWMTTIDSNFYFPWGKAK